MPNYKGLLGDTQGAVRRTNVNNDFSWRAYVAIGASGAATVTCPADANGEVITCVKNTTGVYDVTFPKIAASTTSVGVLRCWVGLSPTPTVAQAYAKAFSPTAGTAQIVTALNAAGTPVEPASGDVLCIEVVGQHATA